MSLALHFQPSFSACSKTAAWVVPAITPAPGAGVRRRPPFFTMSTLDVAPSSTRPVSGSM